MKIVYLGSGDFGIASLSAIADSTHTLELIVTQPTRKAGRGRKSRPTPVALWAKENSIPTLEADNINAASVIEEIASHQPDLIVVISFGQFIGTNVVNLPPKGTINVHGSLLPKYRGAAPVNWPIINGERETGISIITVAEKMDAGDILAQEKTDIIAGETAGQLSYRLAELAGPVLLKTIDSIADGRAVYSKQDDSLATKAPKLKKSDGFIDFTESADSICQKILGLWPWPGVCADYMCNATGKCTRVTIAAAEVVANANPEKLAVGVLDKNLNIICGSDSLKILKLKPAGKGLMNFSDFVNGSRTQPGDVFREISE